MINVLPIREKILLRREYILRLVILCVFLFSLLFICATLLLLPSYTFSQSKVKTLEAQMQKLNASYPDISQESLNKTIVDINSTLALLDSGKNPLSVPEDIFAVIVSLKPKNIKFFQISYVQDAKGRNNVEIHGNAPNREALATLEDIFKKDSRIDIVDLPISSFTKRSDINFTLKVTIK